MASAMNQNFEGKKGEEKNTENYLLFFVIVLNDNGLIEPL